ncbi:50S ribosomal protein L35 [Gehongia tenuis]|jgi:large subunit ribosomal protein L35|uniref:Large ribosomal subunit protein bL35 n=1 Tax=Gehongia tenuis TaxID=2763655 RepID=A0A926D3H8_9FIRM|nr:50S ribosomal protein L35 [Gehongia tenuis]MBC8530638.1 50S ribosomal protein L35 [Gehongia tenuis]
MPKLKTHRGAAKRIRLTKTGKVKRNKAYKSHILNKKSRKRKRDLRKGTYATSADEKNLKQLIPYK